ncbi:MAG: thermonuclease family protein, partial [Desulfotomaculales bacterium]
MPGRAVQPLRALAFWILLMLVLLPCLAGCGPAPAGPGSEPPVSGQTQSLREETQPSEPTQPTESIPTSLLAATVAEVIDGDTAYIRLENGRTEKVRFIGVDTPEIHHPTIGEEPYGREAAAFTARSLSGRKG